MQAFAVNEGSCQSVAFEGGPPHGLVESSYPKPSFRMVFLWQSDPATMIRCDFAALAMSIKDWGRRQGRSARDAVGERWRSRHDHGRWAEGAKQIN
jgi:hypothetical protein